MTSKTFLDLYMLKKGFESGSVFPKIVEFFQILGKISSLTKYTK